MTFANNVLNDQVQQSLLTWFLTNQQKLGLGGIPIGVFSQALLSSLPGAVNTYTASVYQNTNQSINQGPSEVLGALNPYNTLTGNLNSGSLSNNILSRLGSNGLGSIQNNLVSSIIQGLQNNLGSYGNNINFNLLNATTSAFIAPTFQDITGQVSTNFLDGILESGFEADDFLDAGNFELGTIDDPETDLQVIDESYAKNATSVFLKESENFDIQSPDNIDRLEVTSKGFVDPTATFPTTEYKDGSEVNKLAQGEPTNSLVQAKEAKRLKSAPLPGGGSFAEPPSAYKAEYPYNKVTETEQGHVIEIDDTPGSERLHIYHKAGTYLEIDSAGNMVVRRSGSDYQIIDKNGYVSIAGTLNLSVAGSVNLFAGNNANVEIVGDALVTVHNDLTIQSAGNLNLSARETLNLHAANIKMESDGSMDLLSDGIFKHKSKEINIITDEKFLIQTGDDYKLTSNADIKLRAKKSYSLKTNEKLKMQSAGSKFNMENTSNFQSSGDFNFKSTGSMKIQSGAVTSIKANGPVNIDGAGVNVLKGLSVSASDALEIPELDFSDEPKVADNSDAGLLDNRKDFVAVNIKDSQSPGISDKLCLDAEETTDDPEKLKQLQDKLISKGLATEEQLRAEPTEQSEKTEVSTNNAQIVMPSDFCLGLSEAPDSFKLSPNFTLGQLTSRAPCSSTQLRAQANLSFGQILQNLQAVALNVCEPVFNLYPNMYVTSGFRLVGSNPTSQHPKGQAVDVQFKGLAASEYFKIANLLAKSLNYDQLLLEYSNYTRNPWIHISFSANTKNRNQVLTFWNNRTYAQGLVKLA